ncbi:hypothetical protein DGG96_07380 [Legionella qingyii]|uniref:Uncharacterized protein n=1 Tax=Legionella qingyii TaxID=2184757 RepID=A0A317U519_9GAMM|nr:hypothetical protein DGG96_07380 [Legionella qingyii]
MGRHLVILHLLVKIVDDGLVKIGYDRANYESGSWVRQRLTEQVTQIVIWFAVVPTVIIYFIMVNLSIKTYVLDQKRFI